MLKKLNGKKVSYTCLLYICFDELNFKKILKFILFV